MKPKPFHELSNQEANCFLEEFLESESKVLAEIIESWAINGRELSLVRDNIVPYFLEYDPIVRPKFRDWGDHLPEEMKSLPEHAKGESYFEEDARICLLRMGYFFGECLRNESNKLHWAVGESKYAYAGMPVIVGFVNGLECPPIQICENTIRKIEKNGLTFDQFLNVFDYWVGLI